MKGYRFYEEFGDAKNKRKGISQGNVVALWLSLDESGYDHPWYISNHDVVGEGFGAVFFTPNSPVNWNCVSADYLHETCKRVSEKRAREIHPELFKRLDD